MAKCKRCKINIPDGTEYCNDCQNKGSENSNESYLDSLLNSVKNSVPPIESNYKKRKNTVIDNIENTDITNQPDHGDFYDFSVDISDIEDFEQFNLDDDLEELKHNIVIKDEELFGEDLSNIFAEDVNKIQEEPYNQKDKIPELIGASKNSDQSDDGIVNETDSNRYSQNNIDSNSSNQINTDSNSSNQSNIETVVKDIEIGNDFNFERNDDLETDEVEDMEYSKADILSEHSQNNLIPNEILEFNEDDSMDTDLNDLLNSLDDAKAKENQFSLEEGLEPANMDDYEQMDDEEDDFLKLLNQISSDDPVSADVMAINDLLNGVPVETPKKSNSPSDVGEVYSDALKVVSSLYDSDEDEFDLLAKIPDKKKKSKKNKKDKKADKEDQEVVDSNEKPKKSLFKSLFSNVEDKKAPKKGQSLKSYNSGESAATKESSKKNKKKKGAASTQNENSLDDDRLGKETLVNKKDKKKDKKDKKKKTKEIIQVIDEIEEDEGRINRLGASIVFLFFGLLVLLLLVGTNVLSYTLSIQNATNYFDKQKYTQAYNEVYGIEIKDEDIEIYDKIMTVMFVNKQLNSYNSYYSMEKYPEALDSLLKGLSRYEKYIELATALGIKTDLDYVRSQILAELDNVFSLSEEKALQMIDYESMEEYSLKIYDVVLEQMNN